MFQGVACGLAPADVDHNALPPGQRGELTAVLERPKR